MHSLAVALLLGGEQVHHFSDLGMDKPIFNIAFMH